MRFFVYVTKNFLFCKAEREVIKMREQLPVAELKELLERVNILMSEELERYEDSEDKEHFDAYAFNKMFLALKGASQDLQIAYMEADDYRIKSKEKVG